MRKIQFGSISKHLQNRAKQSEQSILVQVNAIRYSGTLRNNDITEVPLGTEINETDTDNIHLALASITTPHILPAAAGCMIYRCLVIVLVSCQARLGSQAKIDTARSFSELAREKASA